MADRQQYRIGERGSVSALGGALLSLVAQPQAPFGLPLTAFLTRMHRQQRIGTVALGGCTQRRGVRAFKIRRGGDYLFIQVSQRQAQRQPPVLRGPAQGLGNGLAIADQAAAFS